jgi:DNA invertase Pin-like site-specific DNA recombinase
LLYELEWRGTSERNRLVSVLAVRALLKKQGLADVSVTTAHRRLMLTVLGRLAEFERELIRARTGEGRERR